MNAHSFFLITLAVLAIIVSLFLYRVVRGPVLYDRLIGLNGISTKAILFLVFIGAIDQKLEMFLDIALGYGLINLVGALAVGKYLEKKGLKV